ncbi:zinc ribbon domain-containing protein [Paenibacillus tuaregi]|uniref:zinc ribbon domain-containing protein n=1 Tax=Paenibacillus tuaregi TaxID=1816681 RepID=UPI000837A9E5|nr:zinc-ribbon domain-containing protein [Paenibacillus tuaregi]
MGDIKLAYCKECGHALSENATFCKECGTKLGSTAGSRGPAPLQRSTDQVSATAPLRPMSKRTKWILAAAGALIVVLIAGYKTGEYLFSKERLVSRFESALQARDSAGVASLLTSNDKQLVINEASVKNLMVYLAKHPNEMSRMLEDLKSQAKQTGDDSYSAGTIKLEKEGKKLLIYDNYELDVTPVYLKLGTNYKNVSLTVDGKEVAKSNQEDFEKTVGPYLPGTYKLEARLKTDFVDLVKTEEADLFGEGRDYSENLELQGEQVSISTGLGTDTGLKGRLFINGKNVGIDPFAETSFGPVMTDGSVKLAVEGDYPWGTMRSGEVAISGADVRVNLASNSDLQTGLMNIIAKHAVEKLKAYTSGNASAFTAVTGNYKTNESSRIQYNLQSGSYYKGKYLGTSFDLDSFDLYYENGQWHVSFLAQSKYNEDTFYQGEIPVMEDTTRDERFILVYDETRKAWLIDSEEQSYSYSSDHVKEITEKSPQVFTSSGVSATKSSAESTEAESTALQTFMSNYLSVSVDAINSRSFNDVAYLIDPAGPAYKESSSYIDHLNEKGITEELLSATVTGFKASADNKSYEVNTTEEYNISYSDGTTKYKKFNSVYKLVVLDGSLRLNKLISTKEQ